MAEKDGWVKESSYCGKGKHCAVYCCESNSLPGCSALRADTVILAHFYTNDTQVLYLLLGWPLQTGWYDELLCISYVAKSTMHNALIQNTLCSVDALDTIIHTPSVSSYLYTTSAGLSGDPSSPETTTGPSTDLPKDDGSRPASTGLPKVGVKDDAVEATLPSSLCSITVGIAGMLSHTLQTQK